VQKADHDYKQRETEFALRFGRDRGFASVPSPYGGGLVQSFFVRGAVRFGMFDLV
jgi:hypothetical protein